MSHESDVIKLIHVIEDNNEKCLAYQSDILGTLETILEVVTEIRDSMPAKDS